jgi:hypothetical protein
MASALTVAADIAKKINDDLGLTTSQAEGSNDKFATVIVSDGESEVGQVVVDAGGSWSMSFEDGENKVAVSNCIETLISVSMGRPNPPRRVPRPTPHPAR